ncbi:MAG: guanylate kinase [Lachnospiraceae bacterium]|nr:guanylate kinase [Lachnospiraceae bacterium]
MAFIFCLIGKSAVGKDSLYKKLLERTDLQLIPYVTGTTRPIRPGETDGVEYCFYTEEQLKNLLDGGKIIELREYQTVYGPWKYFTAYDDDKDIDKKDYLIIATLESYEGIKKYFGEEKVVPVYIEIDDCERLLRSVLRERNSETPKIKEVCRRFLADEKDFSKENLEKAGITNIFDNNDLDAASETIASFIKTKLEKAYGA